MKDLSLERIKRIPSAVGILVLMAIVFAIFAENFFTYGNIASLLNQAAPLMILALGQTLVILTQNTDLSLGSAISMITVIWMVFLQMGIPMPIAIMFVIIVGGAVGSVNGSLVAFLKMPGFIATIAMQYVLKTAALVLSDGSSIYVKNALIKYLGRGVVLGVPVSVIIAAVCFVITYFILYRTKFGNSVFAVGGNREALILAGKNPKNTIIWVYIFAGVTASISGMLVAARIQSGNPIVGIGWEFNSLAAVLLGGTSLKEGKGGIFGTVLGVLMIQFLKTGLISAGVPSIMQNAITGIIVITAIILQSLTERNSEG